MTDPIKYQRGFGNYFQTEVLPGALPAEQNSPQKVPYGLYAEQISGSAFTALRHENQFSWLYRIRPSVLHGSFRQVPNGLLRSKPFAEIPVSPNQLRWDPMPLPNEPRDFVQGLATYAGNGGFGSYKGCAVHIYAANCSMVDKFFYNADGEFLIVPEYGALRLNTEFGIMDVKPGEIAVIQRGIKYQVQLLEDAARGYICENYGPAFRLPNLGFLGANSLAHSRHFLAPVANYEEKIGDFILVAKYQGNLWQSELKHHPLDVVAWHGNYAPYKYDLSLYNVINTVSFDHPDPCIYTVLTSPSEMSGIANVDFVIFPPRWLVADHSFRPPYYHRNYMSEFMGLIFGVYDAKQEGFVPGGASLHNSMSAHGPDAVTYEKAIAEKLQPRYLDNTLAFMFESSLVFSPTTFASNCRHLQKNYLACWQDLKANFHA